MDQSSELWRLEAHSGAIKAHYEAVKAHPKALDTSLGAVEVRLGDTQALWEPCKLFRSHKSSYGEWRLALEFYGGPFSSHKDSSIVIEAGQALI